MRNIGKIFPICLLMTLVLMVTSCQSPKAETLEEEKGSRKYRVVDYELKDYKGMLGIPKEGNCPVVFMIHGAHSLEGKEPIPYYKGFEYLVKELADNGYLAVSVDVNSAYSGDTGETDEYTRVKKAFQAIYQQILRSNKGGKGLPHDLKGKADIDKINMIGHSRGGDNITRLMADPEFNKIMFTSALKLAAAQNTALRETYVDVPTALIYSQYDEDVIESDSANYYYYAYGRDLTRRTPILSAYLYGANHASYNSLVKQSEISQPIEGAVYLEPERQREFTARFALDFLEVTNKEKELFQVFNNETTKKYGTDFMLSIHDPYSDRILQPEAHEKGIKSKNAEISYVVSSWKEEKNTAESFHPPGVPEELPLYKISWGKPGGSVRIPVDGMYYYLTKEKALSFYMALDSSDKRNQPEKPVTFDIVITDAEGKKAAVPFSSEKNAALKYQPGKLVRNEGGPGIWGSFTPLGTELLELKQLDGKIIIDAIVSVEIIPTSDSGALMLGGIDAYQIEKAK